MLNKLSERLADLLKIKNIITLMTTVVFVILALKGSIDVANVMLVVGMVFTYFFNKDTKEDKQK